MSTAKTSTGATVLDAIQELLSSTSTTLSTHVRVESAHKGKLVYRLVLKDHAGRDIIMSTPLSTETGSDFDVAYLVRVNFNAATEN